MKLQLVLMALAFTFSSALFAQGDKVPQVVKETFDKQYPAAENVNYQDDPLGVWVNFTLGNDRMKANYTRKGRWKNTEKELSFEQLPPAVKDGFKKSKYADREVEETKLIYRAGGTEWYRLKVKKGSLQKKYISFDENGKLVNDALTL